MLPVYHGDFLTVLLIVDITKLSAELCVNSRRIRPEWTFASHRMTDRPPCKGWLRVSACCLQVDGVNQGILTPGRAAHWEVGLVVP